MLQKKDNKINWLILVTYYLIFYCSSVIKLDQLIRIKEILFAVLVIIYVLIPLIIWYKALANKFNSLEFILYIFFLALPFGQAYRLGIFLMAHYEISLKLFIQAIPFGAILAIIFVLISLIIRIVYQKIKFHI